MSFVGSRARATARAAAWRTAGPHAPDAAATAASPLIIDLDATLITAHSEKEKAASTFKRGFGFHPLCAFLDHGTAGGGEALVIRLRPGNAGSNTAADHIDVARQALAQLPDGSARPGKKVLIRADGSARDGADVAEFTGILSLKGWPAGMRVVVRRERPHPGAQLRFEDVDGYRLTAFATNTSRGQLPDLELRHRRRARCEDRIRLAKDSGFVEPAAARVRPEPDPVANSSPSPPSSPPGWDSLPSRPARPANGSRNGSACGSTASPPRSPAPADASSRTSPTAPTGSTSPSPRSTDSAHCPQHPDSRPDPPAHHQPPHHPDWNPAPQRHAGHCRTHTTESATSGRNDAQKAPARHPMKDRG